MLGARQLSLVRGITLGRSLIKEETDKFYREEVCSSLRKSASRRSLETN